MKGTCLRICWALASDCRGDAWLVPLLRVSRSDPLSVRASGDSKGLCGFPPQSSLERGSWGGRRLQTQAHAEGLSPPTPSRNADLRCERRVPGWGNAGLSPQGTLGRGVWMRVT